MMCKDYRSLAAASLWHVFHFFDGFALRIAFAAAVILRSLAVPALLLPLRLVVLRFVGMYMEG